MGKVERESGFTFLELILVLSVLTIITAVILPVGNRWIQTTSEKDALQAFMAAVYEIQAYSMANNAYTKLKFEQNGTLYYSFTSGKKEFARTVFPEGMRLNENSSIKEVEFQGNGDIIKSGSMRIDMSTGPIEIRFQLRRGRMVVYEW